MLARASTRRANRRADGVRLVPCLSARLEAVTRQVSRSTWVCGFRNGRVFALSHHLASSPVTSQMLIPSKMSEA